MRASIFVNRLGSAENAMKYSPCAATVPWGVLLRDQLRDRRERDRDRAHDVELDVFPRAVGPHADVVLSRRRATAVAVDRRERCELERRVPGCETAPQVGTEPDDDVGAARGDRGSRSPPIAAQISASSASGSRSNSRW